MKFLLGVFVGFSIFAIGIAEIVNVATKGMRIIEHTVQDQWLQERGKIRQPAPAPFEQPREIDDAKTI
jgi:hypothetical protein